MQQKVKICGIRDTESARVAVEAGADFIGVVFYSGSHRYVHPQQARKVADAARAAASNGGVRVVGLFVNEELEDVLRVRETAQLDFVQLSGNESPDYLAEIARREVPFVGTVRASRDPGTETLERFRAIVAAEPFAVHLDSHVAGMWGGSGVVGDWELARELATDYRIFLAGGLDPANVAAAVAEVHPYVVDVSTGVETDKIKDHAKIRAFIAAARGNEGEGK